MLIDKENTKTIATEITMKYKNKNANPRPSISVILFTYNEKRTIREMLRQLFQYLKKYNVEIIVSDDNSPDGTWKIVDDISKINKNVKLIRRFENRGIGPSLYDGLKKAQGKY